MDPSPWLSALCSVEFDLKVGQTVEHVVPNGALTTKEQSDVAFHTFPDSMSQELRLCASVRDSCFFFRIRRQRVLYGFVFCRQRQDERLARGVDRRAVVALSLHPFSCVLRPLSTYLGAVYFAEGTAGLERVYEQLLAWPVPQYFRLIQLQVAGHVIRANLPPFAVFPPPAPSQRVAEQRSTSTFRTLGEDPAMALFGEMDVFTPFKNVLSQLWSLWELSLTAQPLLILAPSPVECSGAVAALISLISPVPYAVDFRPYFTIQDPEFSSLLTRQDSGENDHQLPTLIGVTNLYFIKVLPLWPNVLSIGERQPIQKTSPVPATKPGFKRFSPRIVLQSFKSRNLGAQVLLSHRVENLWTRRRLVMKADQELCREVQLRPGDAQRNSELLRKHFAALTAAFLEPFRGYFVPVEGSEPTEDSPKRSLGASGLPEFDRNEFLASVPDWPFPSLLRNRFSSLQELQAFYATFLDSPNFHLWFERQQKIIASDLGLPHREKSDLDHLSLIPPPLPDDGAPKGWNCTDEVRLVEEFRRLQSAIMSEMREIHPNEAEALDITPSEKEFLSVFSAMPGDLRRVLFSSPAQFDFLKRLQKIPGIQDYLQDLSEAVL